MNFEVDNQKRKDILKIKTKELKGIAKAMHLTSKALYGLVYIASIAVLIASIILGILGGVEDMLEVVVFWGVLSVIIVVVWVIPYMLKGVVQDKYLYMWEGSSETLHLFNKKLEYGEYDTIDNLFNTWEINYSEIEMVEYDPSNFCIRIYCSGLLYSIWTDVNKGRRLNSDRIEHLKDGPVFITIGSYFKNFDNFLRELEERTGKQVVECEIELKPEKVHWL